MGVPVVRGLRLGIRRPSNPRDCVRDAAASTPFSQGDFLLGVAVSFVAPLSLNGSNMADATSGTLK